MKTLFSLLILLLPALALGQNRIKDKTAANTWAADDWMVLDGATNGTRKFDPDKLLLLSGGTMTGHLLFTDATYDIGASGATRPRNLYLSGTGTFGGAINKLTITAPATGSTLTIADGKTLTVSNTLTLAGTDASTLNIGAGGTLGTGAYSTIANYLPLAGGTMTGKIQSNPGNVSTTGLLTEQALFISGGGFAANKQQIGFGYESGSYSPAALGGYTGLDSGATNGGIFFATREATTTTAPIERWRITPAGDLIAAADATNDIGASGATRPRHIYASGNATLGGGLTVAGTVINSLSATPASAGAAGVAGTLSWDANYIYVCVATNTWKRVAIATW